MSRGVIVRTLGASAIIAFGLVVAGASPASAATTLTGGNGACTMDFAGQVPSASEWSSVPTPVDSDRTHWLVATEGQGVTVRFACTFRINSASDVSSYIGAIGFTFGRLTAFDERLRTSGGSFVKHRDRHTPIGWAAQITGDVADETTAGGVPIGQTQITQFRDDHVVGGFVNFKGVYSYEPTSSRSENDNLQCQRCGLSSTQRLYLPRQGSVSYDYANGNSYISTDQAYDTGQNATGSARSTITYPAVTGNTPPGSGTTCTITSWYLLDTSTGDKITSDQPQLDKTLASGHQYEVHVTFAGSPSYIRAEARVNGSTTWTYTKYSPTNPLTITGLNGTGSAALVSVTGADSDGDVTAYCQAVVSDGVNGTGNGFAECMNEGDTLSLYSPRTWLNYGGKLIGCTLQVLFVPRRSIADAAEYEISGSPFASSMVETVSAAGDSLELLDDQEGTGCEGPAFSLGAGDDVHPFSLCSGPMHDLAGLAKLVAGGFLVISVAVRAMNLVSIAVLGRKTEVEYREPMAQYEMGDPNTGEWV